MKQLTLAVTFTVDDNTTPALFSKDFEQVLIEGTMGEVDTWVNQIDSTKPLPLPKQET